MNNKPVKHSVIGRIAGCAATQTALEHRSLQVSTNAIDSCGIECRKVNFKFADARLALKQGLVKTITGIF